MSSSKDPDALIEAIRDESLDRVKGYLSQGWDVNMPSSAGELPLVAASRWDNPELVRILLQAGADVNGAETDEVKTSPMCAAARHGHVAVAQLLLNKGANVNYVTGANTTALLNAAGQCSPEHEEIVQLLLKAKARVDVGDESSPLIDAADGGTPGMLRLLLAAGAKVNEVKPWGTALIRAVKKDQVESVKVLLDGGADPNLCVPQDCIDDEVAGMTPIALARKYQARKLLSLLEGGQAGKRDHEQGGASVGECGSRIEKAISTHKRKLLASLRDAASPKALQVLEIAIGGPLPEDLKASLLVHDGQDIKTGIPLVPPVRRGEGGYRLMAIEEIGDHWRMWKELSDKGEFRKLRCSADKEIQGGAWWQKGWIPLADNGAGDFLCVDLCPSGTGTHGQIITMYHDSPRRERLAASYREWLEELAETIELVK